jgi:hypothetical protein
MKRRGIYMDIVMPKMSPPIKKIELVTFLYDVVDRMNVHTKISPDIYEFKILRKGLTREITNIININGNLISKFV